MPYDRPDHYSKKAQAQGFMARSVFKLEEIDAKYHLVQAGQHVLDLGASPGSWSQYISQKIGPKGRLLGIDLTPISLALPNALFVKADIEKADFPALFAQAGMRPPLGLVVSDMAPKTSGHTFTDQARSYNLCVMALHTAQQYLRHGGAFVCKIFDGPDTQDFYKELQGSFDKVAHFRPKSVRSESKEFFFVATGFKGLNPPAAPAS
jgi:23S rRNA (uridine2552-2'-O)-methyltransferase